MSISSQLCSFLRLTKHEHSRRRLTYSPNLRVKELGPRRLLSSFADLDVLQVQKLPYWQFQ